MNSQVKIARPSVARNVGLWVLQVVAAAVFLAAGFAKLSGQPTMVENFEKVGVGQWFRYVTGGIEVASAVLLVTPRLAAVGAALLVCTMIGAVLAQLLVIHGSAVPALALGLIAGLILWRRFPPMKAWLASVRGKGAVTKPHRILSAEC